MEDVAIGVTGTRYGWTDPQRNMFIVVLKANAMRSNFTAFHHGLCTGVDVQAHDLVREYFPAVRIEGHPGPDEDHFRSDRTATSCTQA